MKFDDVTTVTHSGQKQVCSLHGKIKKTVHYDIKCNFQKMDTFHEVYAHFIEIDILWWGCDMYVCMYIYCIIYTILWYDIMRGSYTVIDGKSFYVLIG